jgi:hypothetical protein
MSTMTIISTAPEEITPLDKGEGSLDLELKSFPPVSDTIVWFQHIDWEEVRNRCRGGLNNVGLVLAVTGEKIHDLGAWLAEL